MDKEWKIEINESPTNFYCEIRQEGILVGFGEGSDGLICVLNAMKDTIKELTNE